MRDVSDDGVVLFNVSMQMCNCVTAIIICMLCRIGILSNIKADGDHNHWTRDSYRVSFQWWLEL